MKVKLTEQQYKRVILKEQEEEGTGNPIGELSLIDKD